MDTKKKNKTYVYEGVEVVKTGRTAIRTLKSGAKQLIQIEVKSIDPDLGIVKWVDESTLYEVQEYVEENKDEQKFRKLYDVSNVPTSSRGVD